MGELMELSRSECETLLRRGVVGRVAISTPTGPHVMPLNYSVSGSSVVVCTTPYSMLGTYGRDSMLAFEIDHFEHPRQRGWSVVVRGRAEAVEDQDELRTLVRVLPRPWAAGRRSLYLRIPLTEVTGRRLGDGWDLEETLPVRRVL
jgi:nitroimidazol reductase NimA-like FMN-containing flavoprotein (pyridoxamine 5'-phosphate oxidase superfamily)